MPQQPAFAPDSAAVTAECAVGSHDAVAGDDDGDAVVAVRASDGALRPRMTDLIRELRIGTNFSRRDGAQPSPNLLLKGRASRDDRRRELHR